MSRLLLGTVAASIVLAGGPLSPSRAVQAAPVVPAPQALRLAAQCGKRWTFIPHTVPAGYRFTGWRVFAYNVPCQGGSEIRFRRGRAVLVWQSDGPQTWVLPCGGKAIARIGERRIFHRVRGRLEKVWTCTANGRSPSKILASQRVDNGGRAALDQLVRVVASARLAVADRTPGKSYRLPSGSEVRRMAGRFGAPLFLPRALPSGFVFGDWVYAAHDRNRDGGRRSITLSFGRAGLGLAWTVFAGVDPLSGDCPTKPSRLSPKPHTVINGVPINLIVGIHGGSVWRCIPVGAFGNSQPIEVTVWYSIALDGATMVRLLSELVAHAEIVR